MMNCLLCSVEKLRREFPSETLSEDCDHPPLYCLRCAVKAKDSKKCPYQDCDQNIDEERLDEFEHILKRLFPKIKPAVLDISNIEKTGQQIFVATLDGERTAVPYSPIMNIITLKEQIQKKKGIDINRQKLVFQDSNLEVYSKHGEYMLLADYGIPNGGIIHLMVLLCAIPDFMNNVIFDLSWGYPSSVRDFLDASCFVYSDCTHKGTVNYDSKSWPEADPAIEHSGDGMDDVKKRGYHNITVSLKKVPDYVTHLLFTLSVWRSQSIEHFPNPILRFYNAENQEKDLCNTSLSDMSDSEAVVMCYVVRKKNSWDIYESGQLSAGSAINYHPLHQTMKGIIQGKSPDKVMKSKVSTAAAAPISRLSGGCTCSSSGQRQVEIVFSFDTTGSMYRCIEEVRIKVQEIITRLLKDIPSLRIAVFAHGDYCDAETSYVTKHIDFTNNISSLCHFVNTVERTQGGCDESECYELVLHEVGTQLTWSKGSNKSLVVIGDTKPHGKEDRQNYQGLDWKEEATNLFKNLGIRIYSVQCKTSGDLADKSFGQKSWEINNPFLKKLAFLEDTMQDFAFVKFKDSFWQELAVLGHGKYLELNNFTEIADLMLAIGYREGNQRRLVEFKEELRTRGGGGAATTSLLG